MALSDGYPTEEQVNDAFSHEIEEWYRCLPAPRSDEDREVMDLINEKIHDIYTLY